MAGTLPINDFVRVTLTSVQPGSTTTSISGKRQTRQFATQYWMFDCDYRSLERSDAAQVMAFIANQRGNLLDFDLQIKPFSSTQGTVTAMLAANGGTSSTLTVSGTHAIGTGSIAVTSAWVTGKWSTAGVSAATGLKAGDFITFSNHYKSYQLTQDISFNSSGAATLNIYPALIAAVGSSTTVTYNDVLFHCYLKENNQMYEFGLGDTSSINLKLQESF